MKRRKRGIPAIMWVLLGLLAVAATIITFGSRETEAKPFSTSYQPSGTRAFVELLQRNGYRVRTESTLLGEVRPNELPIFFFNFDTIPSYWLEVEEDPSPVAPLIRPHLEAGGRVLGLFFDRDFVGATSRMRTVEPTSLQTNAANLSFKIRTSAVGEWGYNALLDADADLWRYPSGDPFLSAQTVGKGQALHASEGLLATNRFIDEEEHAAVLLAMVALAAQESKQVVFLDASFGDAVEPSLVERIGPWATGAWTQFTMIFVLAVVVWGIRFGFPDRPKVVQRGARELVDAYATMLERTGSHLAALRVIHDQADLAVRNRLKFARDTDQDVVDRALPEPLMLTFREARNALKSQPPDSVVFRIAQSLDAQVSDFLGTTVRKPARRRKT